MRNTVGISQKIKRAWLDVALDRLSQSTDEKELRSLLDSHLREELPGKESRAKASGIVLRIWSGVGPQNVGIRDRALALLPRISGQERIWLHWGMTTLAYPFFRDVAEIVGRMLNLQDDISTAQVQSRLTTTWGDRNTSKEAAQKLITSLVDWEVLRGTSAKGHFLPSRKMTTAVADLQLWLFEAMLSASASDEIEGQQLLRLPELFPFSFTVGLSELRRHEGFNIHRQGLDMDMVSIRQVKVEPPPKPTAKLKKAKKEQSKQVAQTLFDEPTSDAVLVVDVDAAPTSPEKDRSATAKWDGSDTVVEERSIFKLALEEQANLNRAVQILGDTYDLVTDVERLYDGLPRLCRIPNDVETNEASFAAGLNGNLVVICRRQLTLGTLTLLRGYRNESLLHLRKAIETCAYAAKIAKHPQMAKVWIQAGNDEAAFELFRKKFVKLFPADDPLMSTLGTHYDICSKAMHSSVYGLAHYLAQPSKGSPLFDVGTDAKLVGTFITTVAVHFVMVRVFHRLLMPYAVNEITAWVSGLDEAEERYRTRHQQWQPLIMAESLRLKNPTHSPADQQEEGPPR